MPTRMNLAQWLEIYGATDDLESLAYQLDASELADQLEPAVTERLGQYIIRLAMEENNGAAIAVAGQILDRLWLLNTMPPRTNGPK